MDDFSLRRGQTYATIVVDLERHRPIDLLPDRSGETLADWLRANPGIEVIARDRYRPVHRGRIRRSSRRGAGGRSEAGFHVLKNLYDAVERAVERNRHALGEPDDEYEEVTASESSPKAGHPGWGHRADPKRREERLERYERVVELRERGLYVEDIAGQVGLSRGTVTSWLKAGGFPERKRPKKKKPSPVAPYADYLERRWKERCINMARLWREIKEMGYEGSYDAVADHLRCLRKGLSPPARAPAKNGSKTQGARHESQETARLLMLETRDPDAVRPEQRWWLEEVRWRCPVLAEAQELAGRFAKIMREGEEEKLGAWLKEAGSSSLSEIRTFARGVRQDEAAIRAAVAARALFFGAEDSGWDVLWPAMQADDRFGGAVVDEVSSGVRHADLPYEHFTERQVADFYVWMARRYPPSEYFLDFGHGMITYGRKENISEWRDGVMKHLRDRGTFEAHRQIERIMEELPELRQTLKWTLYEARAEARRRMWLPPEPEHVLKLVRQPGKRLVRNGDQLLAVLVESLVRLEDKLQGETPMAPALWDRVDNSYRPKDEDWLGSRYPNGKLERK